MPRIVTKGMHNRKMLILAGIATCLVGLWLFSMLVVLCGVAMIVGAFMLDTDPSIAEQSDYDEQTRDIREAIEAWEQTFQCVSCGNRFVPLEIAA
ncbi:hypothetical protein B0920_16305 [Massilia sp. KIM]|nr:hypothetical protein B0920_16305 [Massilia sp. KIM]